MIKKIILMSIVALAFAGVAHSEEVSLDSCRAMAIENNKQLKIAKTKVRRSGYQRKEALAAYLPMLDAEASYVRNQKELTLIETDAKLPTMSFNPETGGYVYNAVVGADGKPLVVNGVPVPSEVALLPKSALTYDIHNVFAGVVTLTQPIFMGGKIVAMNKIAQYAEEIAERQHSLTTDQVIYNVDVAYWFVVSLRAKERLAKSYVALLDTLDANINAMEREGFATKADVLAVAVKVNEAKVDLLKVENGLSLARMQLAQLRGLPVDTQLSLKDENVESVAFEIPLWSMDYNLNDVYSRRNDVQSLELLVKVNEQKAVAERSTMLPQLALVGAYSVTNPNSFNGFKNEFGGMFSVGAMLKIPIWHWGGNYNKYRASKSDVVISKLELEEAKDLVALQVRQAVFEMQEKLKLYHATKVNLVSAEENLRTAQIGFKEGVIAVDNVMKAQTAWLKANSEAIDAMINVKLCEANLVKLKVESES